MFSYKMIFRLVGEETGNTAMSESFIRVRGLDLEPGSWRIRVSKETSCICARLSSTAMTQPGIGFWQLEDPG